MSIIACRDLKEGDELTIAFVDVNQHPNETVLDCRRRRRAELVRGWEFSCRCERCTEESKSLTLLEELSEEQQKDRSRVEDVVTKVKYTPIFVYSNRRFNGTLAEPLYAFILVFGTITKAGNVF